MVWPFRKRVRQRRLEVRKNIPTQRGALWRGFVQAGGPPSVAIAAGLVVVIAILLAWSDRGFPYRLGDVIGKRYARVAFEAPSEELTSQARDRAGRGTPSTYNFDAALAAELLARLETLPAEAKAADAAAIPPSLLNGFGLTSAEDLAAVARYAEPPLSEEWKQATRAFVDALTTVVILHPDHVSRERTQEAVSFRLVSPAQTLERNKWDLGFVSFREPRAVANALASVPLAVDARVARAVRLYVATLVAERATYRLDRERTDADIAAARASVPVQTHAYAADEVIFTGGALTAMPLNVLAAEHDAWQAHLRGVDPSYRVRAGVGRIAMVALVVAALGAYIALYMPRIVSNHSRGLGIAALVAGLMALAAVMIPLAGWNAYLAAGLATMGAVIVTVAYNRRFALVIGGTLALLLTIQLERQIGFLLSLVAPMVVSVLMLQEIRTRSKVIEVGALASLAAFIATAVTLLAQGRPINGQLVMDCGWAAGGVMAAGFIIQGILPIIENVFQIATAMTLLEWCDADKRLLKRLAMEAPGTFNHSLLLGTLSEAAAEAVGANGLLARVGAYYHDIGKINKPEYFVENQFGSPSKHAKLSPAMSLLIITGHVKDGIEMAKEYGLPQVLHHFIASHHGTTLVQYFYHAATEQQKAAGMDRPPDKSEFRYAGPKPQTKEAAILMLADATESAVRAMSEPTPARIEAQASAILAQRLADGQLDECDLTLRDAHTIEQSLVKSLCGIYHGRIAYPKSDARSPRRTNGAKATGA
ncbi:MAG: HDIG domain-containing protein [Planctomycetes bacterium]|nr:HDIG domain-containing protein [Planctomycetota bacterium]